MNEKKIPCSEEKLRSIISQYGTPFHLYDEKGLRENTRKLLASFAWKEKFREYFAVKANTNPYLLEILKEEGCGADCSSMAELVLARAVGWQGEDIIFSSNNTPYEDYEKAYAMGALINLDDISHLKPLAQQGLLSNKISFRYNPGNDISSGTDFIGVPAEAKYGMTKEQIFEAINFAKHNGCDWIGLHTMVVSNELSSAALVLTAELMFKLALEVREVCRVDIKFIDLGGGIGVAYEPNQKPVDYEVYGAAGKKLHDEILVPVGLGDLELALECGRVITGPYGWLVTTAIHHKNIYKNYIGLDSCMVDLMRPALYGSYHHISVLGKEHEKATEVYDVVGSLCENNDKFAIDRRLPKIVDGDIIVMHDTGAHGYAMGFNYNGKLRSKELLLQESDEVKVIRRAESLTDYFATLDYPSLKI